MRRLVAMVMLCSLSSPAMAQRIPVSDPATDTTFRFDIRERTWTWPFFAAHVGLSCQGSNLSIGTTTAPDSGARQREQYCAGALIEMHNSTLTLRNARGVVHLRLNRAAMVQRQDSTRPRR
jgi:hypothetical protein